MIDDESKTPYFNSQSAFVGPIKWEIKFNRLAIFVFLILSEQQKLIFCTIYRENKLIKERFVGWGVNIPTKDHSLLLRAPEHTWTIFTKNDAFEQKWSDKTYNGTLNWWTKMDHKYKNKQIWENKGLTSLYN